MPTQVKSASPSCVSSLQDELDNKRPSLSSKWETFAANTTLHGLRNVVEDNRSKIRRTIWIIFLCGSTGYYFYFVFLCISKFNELPVQMIISQESTLLSGMDFPAVTICNLNQVMKSKLDMADDDKRFTEMGLNITGCHETRAIRGNLTCGRALRCVFSEQGEETGCDGTTRGKLSKAFNQTSFNMEEPYTNYGHDLEGLTSQFRYCVFEKRKNCSAKDFVPSITKDGICYTFNTGQNNAKLFRSKFEGPELGLNILLDVQTDEATFDLFGDLSSGLKVIIHDRKTLVNRFGGFNVMPGTQAMVGVKLINHTRLPPPYKTKCQQSRIPDIASYSEVACSFMCASNMTIKYCGCRRPGFPGPKTVRVCFPVRDKSCLVSDKIIWGVCNCSSACSELEYESQVSYSRFPDDAVIKILQKYKKIKESPSYMKKNFVFLQVGFQRLAYEKREVVRSYGAESLFGEIGGNMGLLLGCSVLTICEFFEFFLEALMSRIKRRNSTDVD